MSEAGRMIAEAHSNERFLKEHEQLFETVLQTTKANIQERIVA
jgi:hypothetical protein